MNNRQRQKSKYRISHRNVLDCSAFDDLERNQVQYALSELQIEGKIEGFEIHPEGSWEKSDGMDFTVTRKMGGLIVILSFGVTASPVRHARNQQMFAPIPQLWVENGTESSDISKRVLDLFNVKDHVEV